MLNIIGLILIVIGILMLATAIFYARKNDIKNEKKEYKKLLENNLAADEYEPPKPVDRFYEKKPMSIFSSKKIEKAEILDDEEVDQFFHSEELMEDDYEEETNITEVPDNFVKDSPSVENCPEDNEETSFLDYSNSENESTSLLSEEQLPTLDNENDLLTEDETTSILNEQIDFDEETSLLNDNQEEELTSILSGQQESANIEDNHVVENQEKELTSVLTENNSEGEVTSLLKS